MSDELDANPVPHAPNHPAVSDNAVPEGHKLKLIPQKAAGRKLDRGAFFGNVDDRTSNARSITEDIARLVHFTPWVLPPLFHVDLPRSQHIQVLAGCNLLINTCFDCVNVRGLPTMLVPNHRERQLLQYLRGRSWVSASLLPPARKTLDTLLRKEWIERTGEGAAVAYRITEQGMAAKKAPVRI